MLPLLKTTKINIYKLQTTPITMTYYDKSAHIIPHYQEEWYYKNGLMSHHSIRHYESERKPETQTKNFNSMEENQKEFQKYNSHQQDNQFPTQ